MKILSGTSNQKLSKDISKQLKLKLVNTNIKRFADGEIYIEINENIRGNSVFVIQSTSNPANVRVSASSWLHWVSDRYWFNQLWLNFIYKPQ